MSDYPLDIILPVYHEEENVPELIAGCREFIKTKHRLNFILQDRGDPTIKVLKQLSAGRKNIRLLFARSVGLKPAVTTGFRNATAPLVIVMMSDLCDEPATVDKMVKKMSEGFDIVCASRNMPGGARLNAPFLKAFLSRWGSLSLKLLANLPTTDITNSYKCYRKKLVKNVRFASRDGYDLPMEIILKSVRRGVKITDVPTVWKERRRGKSQFSFFRQLPQYLRWYTYALTAK